MTTEDLKAKILEAIEKHEKLASKENAMNGKHAHVVQVLKELINA